jgi:AGCS family alanine or glycine:cation symporter
VIKLTKDYLAQRKEGVVPQFKSADYPELDEKIDSSIWR